MKTNATWSIVAFVPLGLALAAAPGCAETIDETGTPLEVDSQRRTDVELPCDEDGAEDDCVESIAIESAESKDTEVIEVLDFGDGFVLVEAAGPGTTKVIAEGEDRRVKIKYEVSEDATGELRVEEMELGLAAP